MKKYLSITILFISCGFFIESQEERKKELTELIKARKIEQAISLIKSEMEKYPRDDYYPSMLATMYLDLNENEEAYKMQLKAINLNPNNGHHHANLGFLFYKVGNCERAIPSFDMSLDLGGYQNEEDDCTIFYANGVCYFAEKVPTKGKEFLMTFLEKCKKYPAYIDNVNVANDIISKNK